MKHLKYILDNFLGNVLWGFMSITEYPQGIATFFCLLPIVVLTDNYKYKWIELCVISILACLTSAGAMFTKIKELKDEIRELKNDDGFTHLK